MISTEKDYAERNLPKKEIELRWEEDSELGGSPTDRCVSGHVPVLFVAIPRSPAFYLLRLTFASISPGGVSGVLKLGENMSTLGFRCTFHPFFWTTSCYCFSRLTPLQIQQFIGYGRFERGSQLKWND